MSFAIISDLVNVMWSLVIKKNSVNCSEIWVAEKLKFKIFIASRFFPDILLPVRRWRLVSLLPTSLIGHGQSFSRNREISVKGTAEKLLFKNLLLYFDDMIFRFAFIKAFFGNRTLNTSIVSSSV